MDKKVLVLMSTYNGEKYIEDQIKSLLDQTYKNIQIYIRDDGSTDKTVEIIDKFMKKNSNIKLVKGKNKGPAKSFLELIKSKQNYDYYAFCDQDDIWDKDKIEEAIKKINLIDRKNVPVLYFSDTRLVDKDLNIRKNVRRIQKDKINVGNALIENVATGCTCVFNNKLQQLLSIIDEQDLYNGFMHDSLAYRITSCVGIVVYDEKAHISYRQHENNVIGNSYDFKDKIKKRMKNLKKANKIRSRMAKYILENYKEYIPNENKRYVELLANYRENIVNRLRLLFCFKIRRMTILDDVLYRVAIIMGKV